jgi:uncharacterized protein
MRYIVSPLAKGKKRVNARQLTDSESQGQWNKCQGLGDTMSFREGAMSADKSFLGTGWSFPPQFTGTSREVAMVSEERDIVESLAILLSTNPGERVMEPDYGCGIKAMVFEEINQATITKLTFVIERAVLFFEPRIDLELVDIETEHALEGRLDIGLQYRVITTNARRNMVYPFYIMEGTLVEL